MAAARGRAAFLWRCALDPGVGALAHWLAREAQAVPGAELPRSLHAERLCARCGALLPPGAVTVKPARSRAARRRLRRRRESPAAPRAFNEVHATCAACGHVRREPGATLPRPRQRAAAAAAREAEAARQEKLVQRVERGLDRLTSAGGAQKNKKKRRRPDASPAAAATPAPATPGIVPVTPTPAPRLSSPPPSAPAEPVPLLLAAESAKKKKKKRAKTPSPAAPASSLQKFLQTITPRGGGF